jgi:hypothetical protein
MSIASLVSRHGKRLYWSRPTITRASDGRAIRTYAEVSSALFFVQTGSQSSDVFEGRANTRVSASLYAVGVLDIRIDDEIRDVEAQPFPLSLARNFRVIGVANPLDFASTDTLSMSVVDVVQVDPDVDVSIPPP